jgi:sugar lactone lactonase YvrE
MRSLRPTNILVSLAASGLLLGLSCESRAQFLFVSNDGNNTIEEFNSSGSGTLFANSVQTYPSGIAFDSHGNVFVANIQADQTGYVIQEFDPAGARSVFAAPSSLLNIPDGLAFDSMGNLFVANEGSDTIAEYNSSGSGKVFASSGLNSPTALAFDSQGNLYVANGNGFNIMEFNSSGMSKVFAASGVSSPLGMAFDSKGNLFVANQSGIIEEFNSSGTGSMFARLPLGVVPAGLAIDDKNNIFVSTSNNTIEEISPSGTETLFANSGLKQPGYLAFEPSPEPSTLGLVGAALGAWLVWPALSRFIKAKG